MSSTEANDQQTIHLGMESRFRVRFLVLIEHSTHLIRLFNGRPRLPKWQGPPLPVWASAYASEPSCLSIVGPLSAKGISLGRAADGRHWLLLVLNQS